jgi:pyruvate/2-oxoglutarate dehydrogenase complex dihydrolipoamide acyltransferase (E2) component
MSINNKTFVAVLERIADEYNLDIVDIRSKLTDLIPSSSPFKSRQAKQLAIDNNLSSTDFDTTKSKISVDDVRNVCGIFIKKKKCTVYNSIQAKTLMLENNLLPEDFPENERTGRTWKSNGVTTISINDVKKKLGIVISSNKSKFASKRACELAKENNIDIDDIDGTGKGERITLNDINSYIYYQNQNDDE